MLKQRAKAFYLLIIAIAVGYFVWSTNTPDSAKPFRLGLDLSGGAHLVYRADVSKVNPADISDSMAALRDSVERRINIFGVSEPLVQTQQNATLSSDEAPYKLIVELPGITDTAEAARAIGATPSLEFRLASSSAIEAWQNSAAAATSTAAAYADQTLLGSFKPTGLTGAMIERASLLFDPTTNQAQVGLNFTSEGRDLFYRTTRDNIGSYLGIFLDGVLIEFPVIRQEIPNGQAVISGGFTTETAQALVRNLNYGALPIPISLISEQTIGPALGEQAVRGGIISGIISFILIGLFLIIWYRLPGLVATLAMAVYVAVMLALFKLIPVTLTAAGIAGFIITIGMAVDANILIFERMREELDRGRGINDAMHEGFSRAWTSIRDSNISSIITGVILYQFGGTSVVIGFALVFIIGVLVSMFTAITASRLFLYAIAPKTTSRSSLFLVRSGFKRNTQQNHVDSK